MRPLTNDLPDRWMTLFSQRGPRRRVHAGFIERAAESNHVVGDLLVAFVGFDPGASTNDTARVFQVPRLWLPRFARRLNLRPDELIEGLRDRLSSLDDAEELHCWLWAHGWVYTWERIEIERHAIDQHLAAGTPAFPSRLAGKRRRVSILRTELIRSFHGYGEYLTGVEEGYLAACAQVAGVPSWELTPEMCLWAYPEISVDNWDECIEDGSDEMPFPIEEDVLGFAAIPAVMSITKGVTWVAFSCGDSDVWIADSCASYGVHPATNAARLSMLQTLADDLGGGTSDCYELDGPEEPLEAAFRRWCDARWSD
jgi:hypothetical protein